MTNEEKFRRLLKHAWANSRVYREIYSDAGIMEPDLDDIALEDLPVMTKSNLMVRFNEAVTDERLKIEEIKQFIKQDLNPRNLYLGEYFALGSSAGSDISSFVPYTLAEWRYFATEAAFSLLKDPLQREEPIRSAFYFASEGHWVSTTNVSLASRHYHDVLSLSVNQPVEEVWARLNAFQPERLSGYGSSISWIVDWAQSGKVQIKPETIISSGDRLAPFYREKIKELWGSIIYDLYATVEAIYAAVRKPGEEHYQVFTELVLLEVVDEHYQSVKHGERGRVLVTNLVQKTLPLIRFDLYDFATLGRSSFGAETLISLDGKSFDALPVRLKSGSTERIPAYELTEIQVPGLQRIQFLSHSPDHFEVWYMAEGELDREIESAVRSVLETRAAAVNQVDVKRVDYLPSGKGTKFFHVMNPDKRFVELHSVSNDPIPNQQLLKKKTRKPLIPQEEYEQGTIPVVFHRIANLIGDKIAVEDQVNLLTYNQLEVLANNVAYRLLDFPLDPSRPVAIFCPHQPIVTALILGVLKAGGFYLPLDIHLPTSRLIQILAETHPQIMLTAIDGIDTKRFPPGLDLHIIAVDQSPQKKVQAYALPDIPAESPACLIYTSGSTGTPQGFVLSHRTVHRRASRYIEDYRIAPEDKLTLLQSFTVSAGVREIFGALLSGATLSMFDLQERGIQPLPAWIQDRGITHLYMVPSIWRVFLEAMAEEVFESLRMIRLGGEPMGVEDWDGFKARMSPGCILANGYAATETGTICQYFLHQDTEISSGRIPVGFPVNGIEVKLLPENQPSGSVTLGEIAVDSETLAMGSWDPMKKVVLPFQDGNYPTGDLGYQVQDGRIFLLDRKDRLVKVHGNRVNLNEVETAAIAIEGVVSAAAVLMKEGDELASIVLFYVLDPDCDKSQNDIRNELRSKLPGPAVPKLIQQLQDLPRLPGGKVNPYNLTIGSIDSPDLEIAEVLYRNDTEEELAEIWKDILQVERVEREDDFINLGGDSIMVFRVQNRIREHFGVQISVREFFEATQLNTMAAWIMAQTIVGMESPSGISALVTLRSTGSKPPLFFVPPAASTAVQFKRLAQYLGEDQPVYAFEYPGMDGKIEPLTSIPDMAKIFIKEILKIQPLGPYYVAGMCYGGIVAFEVAQQLLGSGLSVAFLGILDSNTAPRKNKPLAYYGYVLRQFIHKNILGREGMVGKLFPRKRRGELDLEDPFVQRIYQVFKANHYAGLQYTSPPYPGLITKFSTDWPIAKQATRFWRNATTVGLEDHVVPGSHIRRSPDDTHMLDEPNIQVVAQKLRECLQRAAT